MIRVAIGLVAIGLAVAACNGDDKDGDAGSKTVTSQFNASQTPGSSSGTEATGATPGAGSTQQAASNGTADAGATQTGGTTTKSYSGKPELAIDEDKAYFATIKMDIGDIKIELFPDEAPETVNSFVFLARDGYFDGLTFHRVIPGFVAQGGDPTGTGRGGPGYTIPDEVNDHKFIDGAVGMAKTSAPDSAGSQFFICYAPQPNLDGAYTVFGQIAEGRDVLDKITPRDPARGEPPGTVINTIVIEEQ